MKVHHLLVVADQTVHYYCVARLCPDAVGTPSVWVGQQELRAVFGVVGVRTEPHQQVALRGQVPQLALSAERRRARKQQPQQRRARGRPRALASARETHRARAERRCSHGTLLSREAGERARCFALRSRSSELDASTQRRRTFRLHGIFLRRSGGRPVASLAYTVVTASGFLSGLATLRLHRTPGLRRGRG